MELIFIETPEFADKIDRIASLEDFIHLQGELLANPVKGKIEKGTGGARKIRMGLRGSGKSGGAGIIYYFVDHRGEIWFLDVHQKSKKESLTDKEKNHLYRFIKEVINEEE